MQLNHLDCRAAACCSWQEEDVEGVKTGEKTIIMILTIVHNKDVCEKFPKGFLGCRGG